MSKDGGYFLIELPLGETLEEVSSIITKDLWLKNQYSFNSSLYNFHLFNYSLPALAKSQAS